MLEHARGELFELPASGAPYRDLSAIRIGYALLVINAVLTESGRKT